MKQEQKYRFTWKNFFRHLHKVNQHRWKVFCLCCRVGIPWQGLMHDLSKYSKVEFLEGVKYYQGNYSPIRNAKMDQGYSEAWLHHKGRNKHHYEYWYDYTAPLETPIMPFRYFLEMICDTFAAGMAYQGKNWTKEYQLSYWNQTKEFAKMHPSIWNASQKIYEEVAEKGIKDVLKKKHLKRIYENCLKEYQ